MSSQAPQSDDREIDFEDPRELPYWLKFLDTTRDELLAAISAVGTSAEAVKQHLRAKMERSGPHRIERSKSETSNSQS